MEELDNFTAEGVGDLLLNHDATRFARLKDALQAKSKHPDSVVIAEETPYKTYSFLVFKTFDLLENVVQKTDYGSRIPLYYHEILSGVHTLVFDIDVDKPRCGELFLHEEFVADFEDVVLNTLQTVYGEEFYRIVAPVWIQGTNPAKASYHLILGNLRVTKPQLKMFYKIIDEKIRSDERFSYLNEGAYSDESVIDFALCNTLHQLRIPWAVKRSKAYPLIPVTTPFSLADGLVTGLWSPQRKILSVQLGAPVISPTSSISVISIELQRTIANIENHNKNKERSFGACSSEEVKQLAKLLETFASGQFEPGQDKDAFVTLKRVMSGSCPISGKYHERSDAYAVIHDGMAHYRCFRCEGSVVIGRVGTASESVNVFGIVHPLYEQEATEQRATERNASTNPPQRVAPTPIHQGGSFSQEVVAQKKKVVFGTRFDRPLHQGRRRHWP